MTSTDHGIAAAWPACALGAWAAAWIAGRCSPDDVVDTLASSADLHIVDDRTDGADMSHTGVLALLGRLRGARGLSVRLPVAGDPQGLPPGAPTSAALAAGEVLLVDDGGRDTPLALIPAEHDGSYRWTVLRYDTEVPLTPSRSPGDVEYELRQAVSSATELITRVGARSSTAPADLRGTLRTLTHRHLVELPPHDDARITRIIATAAQVEAVVALAGDGVGIGDTAGQWSAGDGELRRLVTLTHAARSAAVNRLITEFLPPAP
ncbi:hypothetical protein ACWDPV_10315 [Gordonia sp. NPDC003504]